MLELDNNPLYTKYNIIPAQLEVPHKYPGYGDDRGFPAFAHTFGKLKSHFRYIALLTYQSCVYENNMHTQEMVKI